MKIYLKALATFVILGAIVSCTSMHPLERFAEEQRRHIHEKAAYDEAEFDFWASAMPVTTDDVSRLRAAWEGHSQAFPDSAAMNTVDREMNHPASRVVLVSLFMTEYDKADLRDKSLGWTVSPKPEFVTELSENDVVLRTFMPVRNAWARYFLLRYPNTELNEVTVGNRTSRVVLSLLEK